MLFREVPPNGVSTVHVMYLGSEVKPQSVWSHQGPFLIGLSKFFTQSKVQHVSTSVVLHDAAPTFLLGRKGEEKGGKGRGRKWLR